MAAFDNPWGSAPAGADLLPWQTESVALHPFTAAAATGQIGTALGGATLMNADYLEVVSHPGGCGCMGCGVRDDRETPDQPVSELGAVTTSNAQAASLQSLADYLREGYWTDPDVNWYAHGWNLSDSGANANSGTLLYNLSGFDFTDQTWINRADSDGIGDADRADLFRASFALFEEVLGIDFEETTSTDLGTVDFFVSDNSGGAYASTYISTFSGTSSYSFINVNAGWSGGTSTFDDYTLQTILHEIGHAMGLGHQGTYNGSGSYNSDAVFANDSWQASMMSYFSQRENTAVNASEEFLQTPMAVDWIALQDIYGGQSYDGTTYGIQNAFDGNTIYGFNTNISVGQSEIWARFADYAHRTASTLVDGGGTDTLDVSGYSADQRVDLTPTTASMTQATTSDIGGRIGNLTLAVGTIIENAATGSGNDEIRGNAANNMLSGNGGADNLFGAQGNDALEGGSGNDTLAGWAGNDTLRGGDDDDLLEGGEGDDHLNGNAGSDTVFGGDGHDELSDWSAGSDTLDGGRGNDTIASGNSSDVLRGGEGNDILTHFRGDGLLEGGSGNDTLAGWAGNDTLRGGDDDDLLEGGEGDDHLNGNAGSDTVFGGDGHDELSDWSAGSDTLDGGRGNDTIASGNSSDVLRGGEGNDILTHFRGDGLLEGGSGNDTLAGWAGNDTLRGGDDDDLLEGGEGDDHLNGNAGSDTVFGGDGHDELSDWSEGSDTLDGGRGNDTIASGNSSDVLRGGEGNDILTHFRGDGLLEGGSGNDTLAGWAGNDTLSGGSGEDTLNGGEGRDTFRIESDGVSVLIEDFTLADDTLDLAALALGEIILSDYASTADGDVALAFSTGPTVTLAGLDVNDLSSVDFLTWA